MSGGPQNLYGHFGTEKSLVLTGIPTTDDQALSLVTVPAKLYATSCSSEYTDKNDILPVSEWNTWLG